MEPEKPLIYLILGAAGSGRREVLADIIDGGLAATDRPVVLMSGGESANPVYKKLGQIEPWLWVAPPAPGRRIIDRGDSLLHPLPTIEAELPPGATHIFFVTDGRLNPVDQIEAFKVWLTGLDAELAHVICVVNCRLAEQNPRLIAWYDACIHFSDIVLLQRREGVANKWLSDFQARYQDQFYPCIFELVKAGRVRNPALILEPQALRLSHVFDEETDYILTDSDGEVVDEEDEDEIDEDEEITATPVEDIYFARRAGGRREKEIPDIAKFLNGAA